MSEWKPGDMAVGFVTTRLDRKTLVRIEPEDNDGAILTWFVCDGIGGKVSDRVVNDVRRLAVVDPEDRVQVDSLVHLFESARGDSLFMSDNDHLQAALREFANPTPPKPAEPTGKYAEVEDARGWLYFRDPNGMWRLADNVTMPRRWSDIDAVGVLSEGVPS